VKKAAPPLVRKFPAAKQRRLDRLLDKNNDGAITAKEKATLEQLVAEAEQWMVANTRRVAKFSKSQGTGARSHAVPVTVWVRPETGER